MIGYILLLHLSEPHFDTRFRSIQAFLDWFNVCLTKVIRNQHLRLNHPSSTNCLLYCHCIRLIHWDECYINLFILRYSAHSRYQHLWDGTADDQE